MHDFQRRFLDLAIERDALRFGEFTLKSGRVSPYFFNAGMFSTGAALGALGSAYAAAAVRSGIAFDLMFGPAYKGIALAAVAAAALAGEYGRDVGFAYNRKEAKTHGEGGNVVGAPLSGRVLIVDDVMTAGTAVRESLQLIRDHGATPAGILIALDREERGTGVHSAAGEITAEYGVPVIAIARLTELLAYASEHARFAAVQPALREYRGRYGV